MWPRSRPSSSNLGIRSQPVGALPSATGLVDNPSSRRCRRCDHRLDDWLGHVLPSRIGSECSPVMNVLVSSSPPMVVVLGTRNRKKCREMAELIAPPWEPHPGLAHLEIHSLAEFPQAPEVVEDADTFAGNARKKAAELARALGHWVVADDS